MPAPTLWMPVATSGLQMLAAIWTGYMAARMRAVDPATMVKHVNELVLKLCLPSMQLWLLAVKTDLRNWELWRVLSVYLVWSLVVQLGCTLWVVYREGGDLKQLGMHMLVLTANNTGIIGPVIIEAAAGQEYAVLGILATAAMYFQQLPLAALLFEAQRWGMFPRLRGSKGRLGVRAGQPSSSTKRDPHSRSDDALQVLAASDADQDMIMPDSRRRSHSGSVSNGSRISSSSSSSSFVAQFLLKNPVMWATGMAVVLSLCGAHSYLDPSGPAFIKQLGWVEGVLAWFGRCTTPLTLFSAGAWMHGKTLTANEKRQVAGYVGLRLLVLPPVMMVLAHLCNVSQKEGITLVIIASVPIAQVAYLVSEQYGVNTEAVTSVMIIGLLVLLPHTLLVLGLVEWSGLFAGR